MKKWTIARRVVQFSVVALIASPLSGLSFFRGNLAAGEFFGIWLADPLTFLQAALASRLLVPPFLGAALLVAAVYFLVGGRTFCGWVCPIHLLTELGDKFRCRIGRAGRTFPLAGVRWMFAATLAISAMASVPLFEILSPIGVTTRAIMFKAWLPLLLVAGILVVELCVSRRIWCRSLCAAGGFYSLLGRYSPVRIGFSKHLCTNCGECSRVCMVDEVLEPALKDASRQIASGDCTRCGACIDVCPTKALKAVVGYR